MKGKFKALGIIALTAVILFVMSSCDDPNKNTAVDISQYYLAPPTGIVATLISSNNAVHITWNEVTGAGRYEINYRTNLDSADTRRSLSNYITETRYEHSYYSWYVTEGVTTLYYYIKAHPRQSGYIASGWSSPVSVNIR